ncbi:hypothetical protein [Persicobacter sp. CCB-QB2]|uniref:hypothetical protein n=1 Tax=Persicobacter sp. CCB-QB2 TaxID=1561025 RepID=UPI0006A9EAAC|nr:hypothetical protein [Persicobacter sp. CCB-QB2]
MIVRYLNGNDHLGLVASGKRKIKSGREFDRYFPKPERTNPLLTHSGDSFDTLKFMGQIIEQTLKDTQRISTVLKGKNDYETARNIWNFIYHHIQYTPDARHEEQLRRPARSWADRAEGVDCDCYSILASSILYNLGIAHKLRKTAYNGRESYQHVYVIVPNKDGSMPKPYATIDPVLSQFDQEKPFSKKYDKSMLPIRFLNGLEGVEESFQPIEKSASANQQLYYSEEIQGIYGPEDDMLFFDGTTYYEMQPRQMLGLGGLGQLGLLSFLAPVASLVGKGVKAIGKGIKKIRERRKAKKMARISPPKPVSVAPLQPKGIQTMNTAPALPPLPPNALMPSGGSGGNFLKDTLDTVMNIIRPQQGNGMSVHESASIAKAQGEAAANAAAFEIMKTQQGSQMNPQTMMMMGMGALALIAVMKK